MPELPDVEGFRRVAARAARLRVQSVRLRDSGVVHGASTEEFREAVSGRCFGDPARHGKWLMLPTRSGPQARNDFPWIMAHFGMTGSFEWHETGEAEHPHDRVVFAFAAGELRYRDMRKLAGLHLVRDQEGVDAQLGELGPDARTITRGELAERLRRSRRQLKPELMDQAVLAGLGNLTVDEILWRARIPPRRAGAQLSQAQVGQLHRAIAGVLGPAVRAGRVPAGSSWLTGQRDEADAVCPRCGTDVSRARIGGRSTVWCSRCQPEE
ncbi:Fpg/Nei family DNA glycosylase [Bounagaea algeriensis]